MNDLQTPLEPIEKESSDDMVNIQIEESLVRETLMAIDSANFNEDLLTLIVFGVILVFVILSGIYGPPVNIHKKYSYPFSKDSPITNIKIPFDAILPINSQNSISIAFMRNSDAIANNLSITFRYSISCTHNNTQRFMASHPHDEYIVYPINGTNLTTSITLFTDIILDYNKVEIDLTFDHPYTHFSSFILTYSIGTPDHAYFQIYFRFLFSIVSAIFLALMLYFLRGLEVKLWHLEQKLTVPLVALLIFYNNPFYIFHVYNPSPVFVILDRILDSIFHSYMCFFILVLFDSLRYKNRKTDRCFYIPKIIMCSIILIVYSIHGIYDKLHLIAEHNKNYNTTAITSVAEMVVYLTFLLYTILSILISASRVDVTERYKFNIYLSSGLIAVIIMGACQALSSFKLFSESSLSFVIKFAVENIFSFLMVYFHWPYEVLMDEYNGPQDNNEPEADFFVNEQ
ncbi:hypothetical protein TVAG_366390 [Trichomonas vaginalis G3]|uniref:Wntless-like transmembrane domain-containing protein n=1 Tax=Trichomonas vaginalis (strain ATCC PRA-98 / G3) TaxID=412133 RepID=A2DHT3_TRIV3|nr:transmembrane protein 181 family [Trichomonas vaginalis G3]EAY20131.1 hypothetical protein TVAG_366390 [Trichomonas vaginalis G3]KAI5528083.1 transmembrane protein 181 family [Trichomonas vaginalis G3]|eukprot:XP_001581117.1 hypothetical protein [Trichomonas vaginalis G3]